MSAKSFWLKIASHELNPCDFVVGCAFYHMILVKKTMLVFVRIAENAMIHRWLAY